MGEQQRPALRMNVVVGKAYRHQTPVFVSTIRSVIFRPYWNVPLSIQRAEILPNLRADSDYLFKHGYEVVDPSGTVLSTGAIDASILAGLQSGKLMVRQVPGDKNALGLVKFDFPNQYDVYMHGTPSIALFSKSRRDFSHGCIRVEDPPALAAWVLHENPEWTPDRIRDAMSGNETIRVNLKTPIPVLILYGTATVSEGGIVHFYRDIYGHDEALRRALDNGCPYSATAGGAASCPQLPASHPANINVNKF